MITGEVRLRATRLGFAWHVSDETLLVDAESTLVRDGAGHIICHFAANDDHAWLYMDRGGRVRAVPWPRMARSGTRAP